MDNLNTEIKTKILSYLRKKKLGASSSEIAKSINHNRITVTKYLEIMKAHKLLEYEDVAQAKLWRISLRRNKPSVLIVDDETHVVDLVALSLMSSQYNIIKAYSGLDALEKVYSETPDIIILDLMMPGLNGYEVCRKLKENALTQHIPIIILSAKGQLSDKLEGMKIGADDYITKPFDPLELEARVNVMLRRVKQDIDAHPLTKLPGYESLKNEYRPGMVVLNLGLKGLGAISKKHGFKKTNELLQLLAKIFADSLAEGSFISHTLKDNFVILTNDPDMDKKIRHSFNKMLPYFSKDDDLKLTSKKVITKNENFNDVCDKLGVTK